MNGAILGMSKQEIASKLDEIIAFSGCERYIDTPVKRYSSGMKVRLGFAVAAHLDPEILVVDEVLAVGDAEFQKKAIGKMQDVSQGEGRTVLFVSHNMTSIRRLCKNGIVLENGSVAFSGTVDDAVDIYMKSNREKTLGLPVSEMPRPSDCNGDIKFTSIQFLNKDGVAIDPHCGKYVRIQLGIEVARDCEECRISIDVMSQLDSMLMNLPSFVTNDFISLKKGRYYVNCDIEKLPLTGGSYRLNLWAATKKGRADFLESVVDMDVHDDDYYHTGRLMNQPHLRGKIVLCDYQWNVMV